MIVFLRVVRVGSVPNIQKIWLGSKPVSRLKIDGERSPGGSTNVNDDLRQVVWNYNYKIKNDILSRN
jgi:hypothetical protein